MSKEPDFDIRTRIPPASQMFAGLSQMGYSPMTALADIIDNSIAAGAELIKVSTEDLLGGKTRVYISDNGSGMDAITLEQAMDFGTTRALAQSELSVFGLGLKIASLGISPGGFTVLTRNSAGETSCASWNPGDQEGSPWGLRWYKPGKINPKYLARLEDIAGSKSSGTVVIWEGADLSSADRLDKTKGGHDKHKARVSSRIAEHLSLTFHRYLDGEVEGIAPIRIVFDGEYVNSWNPFDPEFEDADQSGDPKTFPVIIPPRNERTELKLTPYVLRDDLTNHEKEELARRKQTFQGVYVYRLNRLVRLPSWQDFNETRHNSLNGLRFAIEITPQMDKFLKLKVDKSAIVLPDVLIQAMQPIVSTYARIEGAKSDKSNINKNNKATPAALLKQSEQQVAELSKKIENPSFEPMSPTLVVVQNVEGQHEHRVKMLPNHDGADVSVDWVDDLEGGILWETAYGPKHDVRIRVNRGHEFFQKVMLRAFHQEEVFNGFVWMMWSFSRAEFESARGDKTQFADMRRYMSTTLRYAAEELEVFSIEE